MRRLHGEGRGADRGLGRDHATVHRRRSSRTKYATFQHAEGRGAASDELLRPPDQTRAYTRTSPRRRSLKVGVNSALALALADLLLLIQSLTHHLQRNYTSRHTSKLLAVVMNHPR